jgi:2-C-methyl-D-erythritol 4-phosphate cytidylyltransferase
MSYTTSAVVVAAGNGSRMNSSVKKPFMQLCGKPLITYCLDVLEKSKLIDSIVLVINKQDIGYVKDNIVEKFGYMKIIKIAEGGSTRQESVYNGLMGCPDPDVVLIHDAARPFLENDLIKRSIEDARDFGASAAGIPVTNTVKIADKHDFVQETLDRHRAWEIQTPQTFRAGLFLEACRSAREKGIVRTDDAGLVEELGLKVRITRGNENNIKITTRKDIFIAEQILKETLNQRR